MIYVRPKTEFLWWEKLVIENAILKLEIRGNEDLTVHEIVCILLSHIKPTIIKNKMQKIRAEEKRRKSKKANLKIK